MELTPSKVVLIALSSALATAGALGLVRMATEESRTAHAEPPASASLAPAKAPLPSDLDARLRRLEDRFDALERSQAHMPVPVPAPVPVPETTRLPIPTAPDVSTLDTNALRSLVQTWIAEEREARQRTEAQTREQERLKEREFDARMNAHMLALEHDLPEWQENKLADLFLEIQIRREELEQSIDPLTADPAQAEQRFVEFDDWAEQRLIDELGQQLSDELFGSD